MTRPQTPTYALLLFLALTPLSTVAAQTPPAAPLHLSVTHALTPITDVLASLSQQSGVPILADDTVVDTLGSARIDKPTLPEMLDALAAMTPGLTWQRVTIPSDAPLPDADTLSAQVRDLQALMASRITVVNPGAHLNLSYSRTATDPSKFADATDRTVYLVTDEAVRAKRLADKKAAAAKNAPDTPLKQLNSTLQTVQDTFSQMTPAEQMQGVTRFSMAMAQIFSSLDPSVMANIMQQAEKTKAAMANGQMPGFNPPVSVPVAPNP